MSADRDDDVVVMKMDDAVDDDKQSPSSASIMVPPSNQLKPLSTIEIFFALQSYESNRRLQTNKELNSIKKHWIQCKDILQTLVSQVETANHLATWSLESYQYHIQALQAISNDCYLDDDDDINNTNTTHPSRQQQQQQDDDKRSTLLSGQKQTQSSSFFSPLDETIERLSNTMRRSNDNSNNPFVQIVDQLKNLRMESISKASDLEIQGDMIIQVLSEAEMEIKTIYGKDIFLCSFN